MQYFFINFLRPLSLAIIALILNRRLKGETKCQVSCEVWLKKEVIRL